ncbi:MAG TPA: hypothetical protein VLV88_04220 [Terriglobales bacterium]|nr:hypothetical protein [Terriglobales bacterium]
MSNRRIGKIFLAALPALLLTAAQQAQADGLDNAVRSLARKALPLKSADSADCVDWQNHTAVSDARSAQLRALFLSEAGIAPTTPAASQGKCALKVTVEPTPTEIVIVAQTLSGTGDRVFLVEASREEAPAADGTGAPIEMEKELLLQGEPRILDAVELKDSTGDGGSLVVLTRDAVSFYRSQASVWNLTRVLALPRGGEPQRDPRGELRLVQGDADALQINLPGRVCRANIGASGPIDCVPHVDSWRGEILPVTCDGVSEGLGSDGGDWSQLDRVQLMNPLLPETQTPVAGVSVPGPVLSLATGNTANVFTATVFNLATGNYEVYRVTLGCRN